MKVGPRRSSTNFETYQSAMQLIFSLHLLIRVAIHASPVGINVPKRKVVYCITPISHRLAARRLSASDDRQVPGGGVHSPFNMPMGVSLGGGAEEKQQDWPHCQPSTFKLRNDCSPRSAPRMNEIIDSLGKGKLFSTFHIQSGCHQLVMDLDFIEVTAFCNPSGLYEWLVTPLVHLGLFGESCFASPMISPTARCILTMP